MEDFFNGEWLRKASDSEEFLEKAHQQGYLLIWYHLGLCSVKPLEEADARAAATHFYRKVANMSICFGTRGGELWFRRATNPNVDFKVLDGVSIKEVRDSLRDYHYNSDTGPLFCVRLLRGSPDPDGDQVVDQDPSFPHKCHVLFGLHHSITDGTSNMHLMGFFISLLNDVVGGKPVNDREPLGTFVSDEETNKQILKRKVVLEGDLELRKKVADDLKFMGEHRPLIIEGFPASTAKNQTASYVRYLDQSTSTKFIQTCKQNKVTVNSTFTAIVNVAVMDTLVKQGFTQDSYVIANFHTVNLRRYWESRPSKALGMHMSFPLMVFSNTPREVHDQFWTYARDLGQKLKDDVLSGRLLMDKAYALLTPEDVKPPPRADAEGDCDFITSNMGDVTPLATEGGDHVRIRTLARGSTFHEYPIPALANCHTFRGVFTIIFDYNRALIQDAIAERICDQIVKNILEVIE